MVIGHIFTCDLDVPLSSHVKYKINIEFYLLRLLHKMLSIYVIKTITNRSLLYIVLCNLNDYSLKFVLAGKRGFGKHCCHISPLNTFPIRF